MPLDSITDHEFASFQKLIFEQAGISLSSAKKRLVVGRLAKRLRHYQLDSYGEYYRRLVGQLLEKGELQTVINLLTTNETHFFREPQHFEFLAQQILPQVGPGRRYRVWSAAASSGEEAYSTAMVLAERLGQGAWEVLGTDINSDILSKAHGAHYSMDIAHEIPEAYLKKYCLKGVRSQAGTFMIDPKIKSHVRFQLANLNAPLPDLGEFDLILLRNVMIYFSQDTKRALIRRMLPKLKPGGYLIVGHSESLNGLTDTLHLVRPTIYRK